jgi:hypothetical protein
VTSSPCKVASRLDAFALQAHLAAAIAASLGLQKVGILFNQSAGEKEYIMNEAELAFACSVQAEVGEHGVTAIFSQIEEDGEVRQALVGSRSTNVPASWVSHLENMPNK